MASASDYCRSILRVSVAQICQNLGWNATQTSTLELLTDVLERYLLELGKVCHRYCEQFGRTEPNLDDLGLTFRHLGINLGELEDYVRHVDPLPFAHEVVAFPAPKKNNLRFPNPRSREILQHRDEHVHDHLPYMFSGMEDEVPEERSSSPASTSQPLTQDSTTVDTGSPSCAEKRLASASLEGPPSKRSRMTASNLPEEAGHSQYEMTSVAMTNGGFLTPIRGQGRLPDSRTPPPTIRHAITFTDSPGGASKSLEGSEANKENNALEPASKEPVRVSIATGKEPAVSVSGVSGAAANSSSGGKTEPAKARVKKDGVRIKKIKKTVGVGVPGQGPVIPPTVEAVRPQKAPASVLKKFKIPKIKDRKSPKGEKAKSSSKKKVPNKPSSERQVDGTESSRLKELLLSPNKVSVGSGGQGGFSTEQLSRAASDANESVPSPNSTQGLEQVFAPTDIFDSRSSRDNSPERLVIAEAEGRAQEKEEERQVRLKNIDDSINAVIRDSMAVKGEQTEAVDVKAPKPKKALSGKGEKKEKVKKTKSKGKIKSAEFIDDEVLKREAADAAAMDRSMNETIDSVIRQSVEQSSQKELQAASVAQASAAAAGQSVSDKKAAKKPSKKKSDKDKSPTVKKKLKAKLQTKTGKGGELASPPLEPKPFVSDKYSTEELQVYEFADSPQEMLPARRPSQAASPPPPVVPVVPSAPPQTAASSTPLPPPPAVSSPVDVKPPVKILAEEAVAAAASPPASSIAAVEVPQMKPLKIEIPREKERHKEKNRDKDRDRSKEREHRKDKKEKRKDKEKKKKNKDKDRDKERKERHGHKEEKNKEDKMGGNLKIKIKFGSDSAGNSSSVMVTENKPSPIDAVLRQETVASPQRSEILKLVIRRDSGDTNSSQKKPGVVQHTSKLSNPMASSLGPVKSEPLSSPSAPQATPPLPSHWSPLAKTKSPPSRGRSRSPLRSSPAWLAEEKKTTPKAVHQNRGKSPIKTHQSSPKGMFSPSPPRSSETDETKRTYSHIHSPPPPTPSPPPKSPSPMPRTPSPARRRHSSSPVSVSSPLQRSPSPAPKSPTPTPKTPSLSPAYPASSPFQPDHSPAGSRSRSSPARRLFEAPVKETSQPPSPLFGDVPKKDSRPDLETDSQAAVEDSLVKQNAKPGRPRSKSPRTSSPKGKSPKGPKSPRMPVTKQAKPPKTSSGKGRGRPPKVKSISKVSSETIMVESSQREVSSRPKPVQKSLASPVGAVKTEPTSEKLLATAPPSPLFTAESPSEQQEETPLASDKVKGGSYASQSRQRTVEAETLGFFIDPATGQKVWVCPACKMQDDGSPMIGCDTCDDWYHWVCVNIEQEPPEEDSWYCPRCSAKARAKPKSFKPKGKRGRKKKVH